MAVGIVTATMPPGFVTRASSRAAPRKSCTCSITSEQITLSKQASGKGSWKVLPWIISPRDPSSRARLRRGRALARGLASAGFATRGVGFAHGLHTPYWVLRSAVGLPRADEFALVRAYRQLLIRATGSKVMRALENVLNYCFPKSLILYAEKRMRRAAQTA